jgi:hypothetical protein
MKTKLIYPMVVVLFAAACGGGSDARGTAAQQQYETVQEGSAAGVTSTISGPGETLPPMTGTNVDSTNAFALNPGAAPVQQAAVSAPPAAQPYNGAGTPMTASPSSEPRPMTPGIAAVAMKQPSRSQPVEAKPAEPAPAEAEPTPAVEAGPAAEPDTPTTTAEKPKQEDTPEPPADDTTSQQAEEPPPPPPPPPPAQA